MKHPFRAGIMLAALLLAAGVYSPAPLSVRAEDTPPAAEISEPADDAGAAIPEEAPAESAVEPVAPDAIAEPDAPAAEETVPPAEETVPPAAPEETPEIVIEESRRVEAALLDTSQLEYERYSGEITILSCDPTVSGAVIIPESIAGCPVTCIGTNAFDGCSGITEIQLPETIEYIYDSAFAGCINLQTINFPESLLYVPKSAFAETIGEVADGVRYFGTFALDAAPDCVSISLREGTTIVAYDMFDNVTALEEITIPDSCRGSAKVPDSVKRLNLGAGIQYPLDWVPQYSPWYYFSQAGPAPMLEEINISPNHPEYTSIDGVVYNKDVTQLLRVPYRKQAEEFVFPETVTSIAYSAFQFAQGIQSITVPALSQPDSYLNFTGCTGLKSVYIDDAAVFSEFSFEDCTSLESVHLPPTLTHIGWGDFRLCTSLREITIPASVTTLGSLAFDNCMNLESIHFEGVVTDIGFRCFSYCDHLKEINLPEGLERIGGGAFLDCELLETLTIPATVTDLGEGWTFSRCYSLESLTIPDSVTEIGMHTFQSCTTLSSVTLPASLQHIGEYAFANTPALKTIAFPEGLTKIGNWSFAEAGLETLEVPTNITKIGSSAFRRCPSLRSVTINAPISIIPACAFMEDTALEQVVLPDSVTRIGNRAFGYCSSLTDINYPTSLVWIGYHSFEYCTSLTEAQLPKGLVRIGSAAYMGCSSLASVTLPEGLVEIGSDAFFGAAVTSYTIPSTLKEMGSLCLGFYRVEPEPVESDETDSDDGFWGSGSYFGSMYGTPEGFTLYGPEDSVGRYYAAIHLMPYNVIEPSPDAKPQPEPEYVTMETNSSRQLTVPLEGTFTWISSNPYMLSIEQDGTVTAEYSGQGTVYAAADGVVYMFYITVTEESADSGALGDLNGDSSIDIIDVIILNKYLLGVTSLSTPQKALCDVDSSGTIDSNDSLILLKYIVELISSFSEA